MELLLLVDLIIIIKSESNNVVSDDIEEKLEMQNLFYFSISLSFFSLSILISVTHL